MKKFYLIILAVFITGSVFSQTYFDLSYDVSFPFANTKRVTSPASFRGIGLDIKHMIWDEDEWTFTVGASWDWNVFYDTEVTFLNYETTTLYGRQFKTVNTMPLMLNATYFYELVLLDKKENEHILNIWGGLGVGSMYKEEQLNMGTYYTDNDGWQFALAPEIGLYYDPPIPIGTNVHFIKMLDAINNHMLASFSIKYTQGVKTKSIQGTSFLSLNLGLVWRMDEYFSRD